jgi:hypothetical protein
MKKKEESFLVHTNDGWCLKMSVKLLVKSICCSILHSSYSHLDTAKGTNLLVCLCYKIAQFVRMLRSDLTIQFPGCWRRTTMFLFTYSGRWCKTTKDESKEEC